MTENKLSILGSDFQLDFGCFFSSLSVYFAVKTPSLQKFPNLVMESFIKRIKKVTIKFGPPPGNLLNPFSVRS